jgi:peptidoglycan/LPS O-acetylase OafA/YrhL
VVDFVVSLFAFCLIGAGAQRALGLGRPSTRSLLGWLEWKPLVYAGGFSYSLYLIQHPFLRLSEKIVNRLQLSYEAGVLLHLTIVVPALVAFAWVFSELFERPTTSGGILLPALRKRWKAEKPLPVTES